MALEGLPAGAWRCGCESSRLGKAIETVPCPSASAAVCQELGLRGEKAVSEPHSEPRLFSGPSQSPGQQRALSQAPKRLAQLHEPRLCLADTGSIWWHFLSLLPALLQPGTAPPQHSSSSDNIPPAATQQCQGEERSCLWQHWHSLASSHVCPAHSSHSLLQTPGCTEQLVPPVPLLQLGRGLPGWHKATGTASADGQKPSLRHCRTCSRQIWALERLLPEGRFGCSGAEPQKAQEEGREQRDTHGRAQAWPLVLGTCSGWPHRA